MISHFLLAQAEYDDFVGLAQMRRELRRSPLSVV